jgi:acyl transferase domain-containing protein
VIKMIMAMRHGLLPRSLHISEPTPHVDWSAAAVSLLTETVAWPDAGHPRRAGVSSFGISGTNAHLLIEEPPAEPGQQAEPRSGTGFPLPWLISARSGEAQAAQAVQLHSYLADRPGTDPADVAFSLATTRSALTHRAVVLGHGEEELMGGLADLGQGDGRPAAIRGTATAGGKLAYLFTGQGSQRLAMGQELYRRSDAFARAFDEACAYCDRHLERPLRAVIRDEPELLSRTAYAQPALFALETALSRLLESWGLRPDVVAGHSVGELVAAHVAGVLSLDDAAALVTARGALMQ